VSGQLSIDLARLGLRDADRTELSAAVQTTRAILAEYA
jgi:type IV secretion system protein VirD4